MSIAPLRGRQEGTCDPRKSLTHGPSATHCSASGKGHILLSVTDREPLVSKPPDLVQGTLDLLILKMLILRPMNGWALAEALKQASADVLRVSSGSLYPALHKLEQQGWIAAEWRASANNRRAKFYSLTRAGRKQLRLEADNWDRLAGAISAIMRLRAAPRGAT